MHPSTYLVNTVHRMLSSEDCDEDREAAAQDMQKSSQAQFGLLGLRVYGHLSRDCQISRFVASEKVVPGDTAYKIWVDETAHGECVPTEERGLRTQH